jgi:predicted enzyme related to lactoylglutathione lyase
MEMYLMEAMDMKSAFFPADMKNGGIGGCIIQGTGYEPSDKGRHKYKYQRLLRCTVEQIWHLRGQRRLVWEG